MKVFISWSGNHARQVAVLLKKHLEHVNQRVAVFVSSESIEAGSVWFDVIMGELEETGYGIVCVTKSNLTKPWLLFEAGAMAAKFKQEGVVPLLVDASNADLSDSPLKNFNSVDLEKEKILGIHQLINTRMAKDKNGNLSDARLVEYFENNWPAFKAGIDAIKIPKDQSEPASLPTENSSSDETLDEILGLVREIARSTRSRPIKPELLEDSPTQLNNEFMDIWTFFVGNPLDVTLARFKFSPSELHNLVDPVKDFVIADPQIAKKYDQLELAVESELGV